MNSNLLISCFVAVAIHTLVLSLPLHRVGSRNASLVNATMSLSIVSPKMPLSAAPLAQIAADTPSKPLLPAEKNPPLEETSPPRKESLPERQSIATPVAEPSPSEEKVANVRAKTLVGGVAVGTALVPGGTHTDTHKGLAALGNQQGQDVFVYARPKYKENPVPHYPNVARRRGYEGQTLLRVEVLKSGKVGRIEIAASSGFEILDNSALKSVKDWIFVPGTQNGETIDQWVMVPVRFSLR
jgi:TonB family protein